MTTDQSDRGSGAPRQPGRAPRHPGGDVTGEAGNLASASRLHSIVATIGPASRGRADALVRAGATALRLNASHVAAASLAAWAGEVREVTDCPMVIDLQGAKMRLGVLVERPVGAGEVVRFALHATQGTIPLPHPELYAAVKPGDTLSCDDDRVRFGVRSVNGGEVETVALHAGILRPRAGVNIVEHPVRLAGLTGADVEAIRATAALGGVAFAFSFMLDGREAAWVRERAPGCPVVGKVERQEAVANIGLTAAAVDELWICRGDLGAQLGPAALARFVSAYDPRLAPCPVLMAGHVLQHLAAHDAPTRAEVCHLYDLVARGYAGFVLSDETAIGRDPVAAVTTLAALLEAFREG